MNVKSISICFLLTIIVAAIILWPSAKKKTPRSVIRYQAKTIQQKNYNKLGELDSIIRAKAISKEGEQVIFQQPHITTMAPKWEIQADRAYANNKESITFERDVVITNERLIVHADKAVATLRSKRIQSIELSRQHGLVSVTQHHQKHELHAVAQRIVYQPKKNRIIMTGQAQIRRNGHRFEADHIEYDTRQHRLLSHAKKPTKITLNREILTLPGQE